MRKLIALVAAAMLMVLAACSGQTNPETDVTENSAKAWAQGYCNTGDEGHIVWGYRKLGSSGTWTELAPRYPDDAIWPESPITGADADDTQPCPSRLPSSGEYAGLNRPLTGLDPGTTYEYRVCFDFKSASLDTVCADNDGPLAPTDTPAWDVLTTSAPAPLAGINPGIVSTANHSLSAASATTLGAEHARVEFQLETHDVCSAGAARTEIDALVDNYADRGIRVLLLAGFHADMPTQPQAELVGCWAERYGPGGGFWADRDDGELAVRQIEFGNETSYRYQYNDPDPAGAPVGDWWASPQYLTRASTYAHRAVDAAEAIEATGRAVELLVQAEDGGSGSSNWVDTMFGSEPTLDDHVGGWTVHPYGQRAAWEGKLDRMTTYLDVNVAADESIPFDITEYGITTDDGNVLDETSGWSNNLTYASAATNLTDTYEDLTAEFPRVRDFMVFSAQDNAAHGATNDGQAYFGSLKSDGSSKGAVTPAVQAIMAD